MRVQTQNHLNQDRGGPHQQPPTYPAVPRGRQRPGKSKARQDPHRTAGETREAATAVVPADAGLALPRLEALPTTFKIDNQQAQTAQLALKLLEAGIIQDEDGNGSQPLQLIQQALARNLGDGLERKDLELEFRLVRPDESDLYYLLVFIEGAAALSFDRAAALLDPLDPRLGPSLLHHIYRNLPLVPTFTPEVAVDTIRWLIWHGEDDDTALLYMARDELEHQYDGHPEAVTDKDVADYAQEHYLTVSKVDERLPKAYQASGGLSLEACRRRCKKHGLTQALELIATLKTLGQLQDALPELDRDIYDLIDGEIPFGLIVSLGEGYDLVREMYDEHEQMIFQSGMDFQPTYALAFDPDQPETLTTLRDALALCNSILRETNTLMGQLEVLGCL